MEAIDCNFSREIVATRVHPSYVGTIKTFANNDRKLDVCHIEIRGDANLSQYRSPCPELWRGRWDENFNLKVNFSLDSYLYKGYMKEHLYPFQFLYAPLAAVQRAIKRMEFEFFDTDPSVG